MTGLDKIIDRILSDAKARAREILETAGAECRAMAEDYATRAEQIRHEIASEAETRGEAIVARARSAVAMERRTLLAQTKAALVDEAFEGAKAEVRDTDFGKYRELLIALLAGALVEETESADRALEFGDEVADFEYYEVLFNEADRATYGNAVVEGAKRACRAKIGAARAEKVRLSDDTADIDGGLVLRCGDVELNCSLSMLMSEMRRAMESGVSAILFADQNKK